MLLMQEQGKKKRQMKEILHISEQREPRRQI